MTDIDLSELSLEELKALKKRVDDAVSGFALRRKAEALAEAEKAAKALGFTLADLIGVPRKRRGAGIAKFAHPENPIKTWTGFGPKPQWLADALAKGGNLEDFAVGKVQGKKAKA